MLCAKCSEDKEESRFEVRKDRGRLRTVCKDCKNAKSRQNYVLKAKVLAEKRKILRDENQEIVNAKARERYWKNRDMLLDKARNRASYKNVSSDTVKKWRLNNKHKCAAHQSVIRALKSGRLVKSERCQMCSSIEKLNAHHHDYSKPLDVIWLCISCHRRIHSKYFKNEVNKCLRNLKT